MNKLLVLLVCVSIVAAEIDLNGELYAMRLFNDWMKKYEKLYPNGQEMMSRFENFKATLKRVEHKNSVSKGKATYAPDKFADLTREEMAQMKLPRIPAQAAVEACLAQGIDAVERAPKGIELPTSFDWRTTNKVTPVKNQGQCGSCWTFSTTGAIESAYAIKNGIDANLTLSEQAIVDCSHACSNVDSQSICNQGCNGGWPWTAVSDVISWGGLPTEADYPYQGVDGSCQRSGKKAFAAPANFSCLSGPNQQGTAADEANLMPTILMKNGPLSIALDADLVEDYSSGIIDPYFPSLECDPTSLDHAVLIVGWGVESSSIFGDTPYWIVKNSWGGDWGENGYFRIYRGQNVCGLANAVMSVLF